MQTITQKTCTKCKQTLPASAFHKVYKSDHKLQSWCKKCGNALRMLSYQPRPRPPTIINGQKTCSACRHALSVSAFAPKHGQPGKLQAYCRLCSRVRLYGLTKAQWLAILEAQNGCCATCDVKLEIGGKRTAAPCVDHDHETGLVRGILCHACNRALGDVKDSVSVLTRLIQYLKCYQPSLKVEAA